MPTEPTSEQTTEQQAANERQGEQLSDVEKLTKALEAERNLKRQQEERAKQLEAQLREVQTVNPKLVEEAVAKAQAAEQQRQLIEQQTKARLEEQERKYQEQLSKLTSELQSKASAAEREALRIKVERDFLASKGLTDASTIDGRTPFDYIWQVYGSSFAEDKNGIYMLDGEGPALDKETGKRITPRDHFAKLRKDPVHGMHFQPEYGAGGGSRSSRDGRVSTAADLSKMPTKTMFAEAFGRKRTA